MHGHLPVWLRLVQKQHGFEAPIAPDLMGHILAPETCNKDIIHPLSLVSVGFRARYTGFQSRCTTNPQHLPA